MVPVFEQLFDVVGLTPRKKIPVAGGQTARCLRGNARGYQAMGDSSTKQFPHFLVFNGASNFLFLSEDTQHPFC
jgi:hypothetical protein